MGQRKTKDDHIFYKSPLLNPYILEMIFEFMNVSALKRCRLVNHFWNKKANSKLAKLIIIKIKFPYYKYSNANCGNVFSLSKMLNNSYCPQILLTTIQTRTFLSLNNHWTTLFEQHGQNIKNLTIIDSVDSVQQKLCFELTDINKKRAFLHKCLTVWCTNLLTLKIELDIIKNSVVSYKSDKLTIDQELKLKEITLIEPRQNWSENLEHRPFFCEMLSKCPDLNTLIIKIGGYQTSLFSDAPPIFKTLLDVPSIATKLQKFHFDISLYTVNTQYRLTPFYKFVASLKNVNNMTMYGVPDTQPCSVTHCTKEACINKWKQNVTHLRIFPSAYNLLPDSCVRHRSTFVHSFNNLTSLEIFIRPHDDSFLAGLENGFDICAREPLTNLKRLTIINCLKQFSSEYAAENFTKAFPNIEFARLAIIDDNVCYNVCEIYLPNLVRLFAVLKGLLKLKQLQIEAFLPRMNILSIILSMTSKFPSLNELCLSGRCHIQGRQKFLTYRMLAKPLIEVKNLQSIILIKSQISYRDKKKINGLAIKQNVPLTLTSTF